MEKELSAFQFGPMVAQYWLADNVRTVSLSLLPASMVDAVVEHRAYVTDGPEYRGIMDAEGPFPAFRPDLLVHCKIVGDRYPGDSSQGQTMRFAPSAIALVYDQQEIQEEHGRTVVTTRLKNHQRYSVTHVLTWWRGSGAIEVETRFTNESDTPLTLEMLSAFSIGRITPFAHDDAPGRLVLYRTQAAWSGEGRLERRSIEETHLERTWLGRHNSVLRFGQVGSQPVRQFFPFVAIGDVHAKATWAAQLAYMGSWQMEVHRPGDFLCLSGGWADRELGHWTRTVAPGESIASPRAILTCVSGGVDEACRALQSVHQRALAAQPQVEHDLPIICNEWCTSWGHPSHDYLIRLARRLRETHTRYLVIDAGWYKPPGKDWRTFHGSWLPSRELFPNGLKATADAIRAEGLIPGLWFELETLGPDSEAIQEVTHQLTRDGFPLVSGVRRFWDFRDPWVHAYLAERVIGLLRECGFGYLKIDYNECIGMGVDGAESPGEGLRQHLAGVREFFRRIRRELPDLVMENCSSGGRRLEPSMMELCAMASFSDAHETREIPIVAANVQRMILPAQNQIWAVLRKYDDVHRLIYSLAATFLGRMCISGDLLDLDGEQWAIMMEAQELYRRAWRVIKEGRWERLGPNLGSYRHPQDWQAVRMATANQVLVIVHTFDNRQPERIEVQLPDGQWEMVGVLASRSEDIRLEGTRLTVCTESFRGYVALLENRRVAG